MKKTFSLAIEGKNPDRVLDATKHEIRKYLKRERRRELPAGIDFWDFDCKVGAKEETAVTTHVAELIPQIDALVVGGATTFYVEILAKHGLRKAKAVGDINQA